MLPPVTGTSEPDRAEATYRHYTDEVGRRGIRATGLILPSIDGFVYITPEEYESADAALTRLALPRTPAGYLEVPASKLDRLSRAWRAPGAA